ncbi:hypothetical protein AB0L53_54730 [Nonomuraea sp. NPDC052129]|uniref:hypothetical protein n=1 Tax=Nonomuraea sp. NPDC052129 TaxID=3154651 RepID=UPI00342A5C01
MTDRTVTTRLKLDTLGFTAGGNSAKSTLRDLDRKFSESAGFAKGFRKQLEDAAKRLPPIDIDVNSSAAEVKLAELRSRLESLSSKTVGVDIDSAEAYAELQALQRELASIDDNDVAFEVRASVTQALADLAVIDREISRVDGRDARVNVDADVSGALSSIALVGAALAALPAVTTIAVGVMALGGAFAAAGIGAAAFGAATVPVLGRINQALTAQEAAAKGAGAATGGAGQSAAQAAQQAMQLEQAEKRLKDAQQERKQAQEDLTRAVEDGRRALEDMNFSLERSVLSQKDAALAVREAEARLAELQSKGDASELEIERAMLNVDMAHQRAREQEVKTQRAKKDTAAANREGVKGTQEYQRGLDNLRQAEAKVQQASDALKAAHLQQQAAMSSGGGGAAKLKDAFGELNAQEKELAKNIRSFKDEYVAWQRSLEPDTFAVINQGLDLMRLGLKEASPLARTASSSFLTLGKDAETALTGPFWQTFLYNVNTAMPGAIIGLGHSFGNVVTGIAGVINAFLPFTSNVINPIENASKAFADWGTTLKDNPAFHEFIADVKANAPQVWQLVKDIASALGNVAKAVGPLAPTAFSGLGLLADLVKGMDPGHIQAIALAIGAIKLATLGMGAIKSWENLAGGIDVAGAAAGKTSGKVAALGKAAIGVSAAVIGLEATGSVMAQLGGQSAGIDKLTLALTELGQTGKWSGDLQTQWLHALDGAGDAAWRFGEGLRELQDPSFGEMYWLHPLSEVAALLPGIDSTVDQLEQKFADLDTTLAGMVSSGNGEGARKSFDALAKQASEAGIPIDKLRELLPTYSQAVRVAGNASAEAAAGVDKGKLAVDGFNKSLDVFTSRTDALQAMQAMKTAYNEAEKAIEAANGKLQVNAQMTDKQRDAVIQAREKFAAYVDSVKTAADGAFALTGRTTESTRAVLEQLPHLASLAGKNSEAKEQVLLLAKAYGISRDDAIKAMSSAEGLKKVLAELKSKEIRIGLTMDVSKAEEEFGSFIKRYSNKSLAIALATKVKAAGGIQTRSGVDLMAAGGLKGSSSTSPPPPAIRSQPTYVPGDRVGTVYAEAGREAYIPYDTSYRQRAIKILGQVASDFGLELYSADAEKKTTTLVAGLQATNASITTSLDGATRELDATLGSSGTLTQSVASVGTLGSQVAQSWVTGSKTIGESVTAGSKTVSGSVTGMADAVTVGSDKIVKATDLVKEAALRVADALSKASSGSGKGSQGSTNVPAPGGSKGSGKGSQGSVIPPAPGRSSSLNSSNSVAGDFGASGYMSGGASLSTNYSKVSAPQQVPFVPPPRIASPTGGGGTGVNGSPGPNGGGGPAVVMYGTVIRESMDADAVTAKIGMVVDSRG